MYVPRGYLVVILAALAVFTIALSQNWIVANKGFAATTNNSTNNNNNTNSSLPSVKLVYENQSYDMLPFVVVDQNGVKKLNFPQLADEYKPLVTIPSDATFNIQFATKPREVNAFGIDYDADTTEVNPLTKIDKYQYSFGKLNGIYTLEVRAIYNDGKYVTYTGLVNVGKNTNEPGNLGQQEIPSGNQTGIPDIFS
jgi:hypothetical protein